MCIQSAQLISKNIPLTHDPQDLITLENCHALYCSGNMKARDHLSMVTMAFGLLTMAIISVYVDMLDDIVSFITLLK